MEIACSFISMTLMGRMFSIESPTSPGINPLAHPQLAHDQPIVGLPLICERDTRAKTLRILFQAASQTFQYSSIRKLELEGTFDVVTLPSGLEHSPQMPGLQELKLGLINPGRTGWLQEHPLDEVKRSQPLTQFLKDMRKLQNLTITFPLKPGDHVTHAHHEEVTGMTNQLAALGKSAFCLQIFHAENLTTPFIYPLFEFLSNHKANLDQLQLTNLAIPVDCWALLPGMLAERLSLRAFRLVYLTQTTKAEGKKIRAASKRAGLKMPGNSQWASAATKVEIHGKVIQEAVPEGQ